MSEHLTHFTTLRECYHAFYRALFLLSREEEIGSAPEAYMQALRETTAEKLAALHTTLESIKREYGLLEAGEKERRMIDNQEPMIRENFCCRCKENFPVHGGLRGWQMGEMRPLSRAPRRIREQFADWLHDAYGGWLCGNCYFDLTDEEK